MKEFYDNFPGHDRFKYPEGLVRVTAGKGGEAILVYGSEKTFLVDCGMAYCGEKTVRNIEFSLAMHERKNLDGILISHTHYDHIGALPYILKRWPEAKVYGAPKARKVFESPGARKLMKELSENARNLYSELDAPILVDGMRVDVILQEGDRVSIGDEYFVALETKGHTDCSMSYVLEPRKIMFASESTGVLESPTFSHTSILKSYHDSIESAVKCKNYGAKVVICPHFGVVPAYFSSEFFDVYIASAEFKKNYILDLHQKGLTEDEILDEYVKAHWKPERAAEHPKEAFLINARHMIKVIINECA